MEKLVSFDLDGIFIPDLSIEYSDESFMDVWSKLKPIFVPKFPIHIITMRNDRFKQFTIDWLNRYNFIIADIDFVGGDMSKMTQEEVLNEFRPEISAMRKVEALNKRSDIKIYLESSKEIVDVMHKISFETGCRVPIVHFNKFIDIILHDLYEF